jgi:hypothetical protein
MRWESPARAIPTDDLADIDTLAGLVPVHRETGNTAAARADARLLKSLLPVICRVGRQVERRVADPGARLAP